jgi:hypothetical protein
VYIVDAYELWRMYHINLDAMTRLRTSIAILVTLFLASHASNTLAASNPIPGVGVVIKRQPGSSSARTTTDKDGNFTFEGLEPGTYTIEVVQTDVEKYFAASSSGAARKVTIEATGTSNESSSNTKQGRNANTGNQGNAGNSGMAGGIAELCVSSTDEVTIDGVVKKAGEKKFYDATSTVFTVTVGRDGKLSGQLRAGVSTSRSNIRTR